MERTVTSSSLDTFNKSKNLTLEEFQNQLPRKMTIHLLSNISKYCKDFIEHFTNEKLKNSKELLEKNIKEKINLYSFMNYKIYEDVNVLMKHIKDKIDNINKDPKSLIFSEVLIIFDNDEIEKQIDIIKNAFQKNDIISQNSYYIPFVIIISPKEIELKNFLKSKTFQYKITLRNILNYNKEKKEKKNENEVLAFFRKLNVIFCYYNELGDEFSFINSKNMEIPLNIEDDPNISIFVNFLVLGRTGTGKSKLINLILEEMKSIEGGTGFSTTSKKMIVYKKRGYPIRFYDVKGIENDDTSNNYEQIMTDFNIINNISNESINVIFYCIEYKKNGTIIEQMEFKLFEKLIQFDIPIIFIITKTPYNPDIRPKKDSVYKSRENEKKRIINAINSLIKESFKKNKINEAEAEKFIDNYIKIFFVNLVRMEEEIPIPVFGINKVLFFLSDLVSKNDWDELESSCNKRDEEKCKQILKKNVFLKYYSKLENLNEKNLKEGKEYLKGLKAGAFISGMLLGIDIGMEYCYKYLFKQKLKSLYGFDYDKALKILKIEEEDEYSEEIKIDTINSINDVESDLIEGNNNKTKDNEDSNIITETKKTKKTKKDDYKNDGINQSAKNTGSAIRIGGIITLETGVAVTRAGFNVGLKVASGILLPLTCVGFGTWSLLKIDKDCKKILDNFEKASFPMRFETLLAYIKSIKQAISHLKYLGQKIIEEDEKENNS